MDILAHAAARFGNAPMLYLPNRVLSFHQCNEQAAAIAARLQSKGVRAGAIVAILSPNTPELVLLLLALLKSGIIAAPLNHRLPQPLLTRMVERLQPCLLISDIDAPHISNINNHLSFSSLLDGITYSNTSQSGCPLLSAESEVTRNNFPADAMQQPVTIIHTSASSGEAKAALHSLANHWYSALGSNHNLPFASGDCWLLSLPLCHIGGYSLLFRALLSGGALAISAPHASLSNALSNFPLTHLSLVPTQLYRLLADSENGEQFRSIKAILLGGSAAPASLIEEALRRQLPLYLTYGSTEMSSQIATSFKPLTTLQLDSGTVLPYRQVAVSDDGELLVKGECLFLGYLRDGEIAPQRDGDGWFHTADVGTLAADGTLTVLGRKDNMFIVGGENIHPEEIERALLQIDSIHEAIVVPAPDAEYGQRPVAFIATTHLNEPTDAALMQQMRLFVGTLKTPQRFYRVTEWELLSGSQKINRRFYKEFVLHSIT
uniref:O-succinylbenzoate-CoA ligase n=1 Tax=Chlorobium chlorochromatii (strain CaD3) TaxID=340177 RepID=Q3AQ01_CHLCH